MGRTAGLIALALSGVLIAGCGGTKLFKARSSSSPQDTEAYLAQLSAEQAQLARAERRIPAHPRTPAALSRSISLLAAAIEKLAKGLAGVKAPPQVASEHARLVSIVRSYGAQLSESARIAVRPGGEGQAETMLISATDAASSAFTSTVAKIDTTLGRGT